MVNFRGALAAPWPNRIADGRYRLDGVTWQLPINEPSRDCALHGLFFQRTWHLVKHSDSEVVLGVRLPAGDGYPFQLDLVARYSLDMDGLTTTVEATNSGTGTAPYGVCPHPDLRAGDSPWTAGSSACRPRGICGSRPTGCCPMASCRSTTRSLGSCATRTTSPRSSCARPAVAVWP